MIKNLIFSVDVIPNIKTNEDNQQTEAIQKLLNSGVTLLAVVKVPSNRTHYIHCLVDVPDNRKLTDIGTACESLEDVPDTLKKNGKSKHVFLGVDYGERIDKPEINIRHR